MLIPVIIKLPHKNNRSHAYMFNNSIIPESLPIYKFLFAFIIYFLLQIHVYHIITKYYMGNCIIPIH